MVRHIVAMAVDIGVQVVAEGIETAEEYEILCDLGVTLLQGYFFAKPAFEALADPVWPPMPIRSGEPITRAA
jgi:EAL domain-containing protein (putative c-di-GMP-specific phosphodiesterase class I)